MLSLKICICQADLPFITFMSKDHFTYVYASICLKYVCKKKHYWSYKNTFCECFVSIKKFFRQTYCGRKKCGQFHK